MGGYIGATAVGLTTTAADVQGDITSTDTTPELILKNTSEEDTEGGREGKITFKGEQSGGEESTLAQIESAHDGTSDDQKGDLIFKTNDGSDGASPTERVRIDSAGNVGIGTNAPSEELHIYKNTTNSVDLKLENSEGSATLKANNDGLYFDADAQIFRTEASTERMRIDSSGQVGIGTSSPSSLLHVNGDISVGNNGEINNTQGESIELSNLSDAILFNTASTERMRIDSVGRLLFGKTTAGDYVEGFEVQSTGAIIAYRGGGVAALLGRTTDGEVVRITQGGAIVGRISAYGDDIQIGTGNCNLFFNDGALSMEPRNNDGSRRDNALDMGHTNARFDDIRATNGTIQTSDRNEKQDIEDLSEAELRVATAAKGLIKKYRWIDAVQKKGDDARIHVGIIAQDLQAAFEAEGLDAGRYAMFISDTWWEADRVVPAVEANEEEGIEAVAEHTVTDTFDTQEEAPEGATERTRLGVRYPELLAFIIGAM